LYAEFATDAKVQSLSEVMQRRYIMLLCLKCNDELPGLTDDEVACAMRISEDEALQTKEKLTAKGLITETWEPTNWDKRQYVSDTSNERVKKYRDKLSSNTDKDTDTEKKPLQKRKCNVTVTLQQNAKEYFNSFWAEYPNKISKQDCIKLWAKIDPEEYDAVIEGVKKYSQCKKVKEGFIMGPDKWLRGRRWEDEVELTYQPKQEGLPDSFWRGQLKC
jgi:hypothetical protein